MNNLVSLTDKENKIEKYKKLAQEIKYNIVSRKRPLIIEFSGLPKSGKTTVVNSLALFLRRNKIPPIVVAERASICPILDKHHPDINIWTGCTSLTNLLQHKQSKEFYVIILDRGIFDSLIWMNILQQSGKINTSDLEIIEKFFLLERWRKQTDLVIYMKTSVEKALEREFKDLLTDKSGSIMKESFLNEFLNVADECIDKYGSSFKKLLCIDTTDTTTIEGVELVTSAAISSLRELSDEEIATISKAVYQKKLNILGFESDRNKFNILERIIRSNTTIMRRSYAEDDNDKIQLIICSIIVYKDSIALFSKQEFKGDRRFHNKNMIWIGGHLQKIDIDQLNDITLQKTISNCVIREIEEEIQLSFDIHPVYKGLVYDNTHPRSKLHLGVVFQLTLKDEKVMKSINNKTFRELSGQAINVEFIPLSQNSLNENIESLEPWSVDILKSIFGITVKRDRSQMVLF